MLIKAFHRRPLPGAAGIVLKGRVNSPHILELESAGLFDAVLRRLPDSLRAAIAALVHARSEQQFEECHRAAIDATLDFAAASDKPRVVCPLCADSASTVYEGEEGFAFPTGLHKHLAGHQRSHECVVLAAARRRAAEFLDSELS